MKKYADWSKVKIEKTCICYDDYQMVAFKDGEILRIIEVIADKEKNLHDGVVNHMDFKPEALRGLFQVIGLENIKKIMEAE